MNKISKGFIAICHGGQMIHLWALLAWVEIRQRYRRSKIGPFWLTITMACTVAGIGPLYALLFGIRIENYLFYLTVGMVVWSLISGIVTDTSNSFISSEALLKEFDLPAALFIFRSIYRNFIIFMHNLVVVAVVYLIYPVSLGISLLTVPLALFMIFWAGVSIGSIMALLCVRFRDVQLVIGNVLQIVFFMTPIMWKPSMLGEKAWLLNFNPVYVFLQSVRGPLTGESVDSSLWLAMLGICLFTTLVASWMMGVYGNRMRYWL